MVTVTTNIEGKSIPEDFNAKLTYLLAESMNKPVNRIAVLLEAGARFTHGATFDPAVLVTVRYCLIFITVILKDRESTRQGERHGDIERQRDREKEMESNRETER